MIPTRNKGAGPNSENMAELARESTQKEWRRPELRKLPIAATAGGTKGSGTSEGVGMPKTADGARMS
jgi:hypothetical protein